MTFSASDRETLRALASRMMELASLPVMAERKRLWTALKDMKAERPMVLFEVWTLDDFVRQDELVCSIPETRRLEYWMKMQIREAEEIQDDLVIEPVWRVGYSVSGTGYGVDLPAHHATDESGGNTGYAFDHPIKTPDDLDKLRPQTWTVNHEATREHFEMLSETIGDIMPVVMHGTTGLHGGTTNDVFKLLGNENLLMWPYDAPEALHRAMKYMSDDRIRFHKWLENEGLLGTNNNSTCVGSGSPGFITGLPVDKPLGQVKLKDTWMWMESQETTCISPDMFGEFFLPYLAEICKLIGLIYYGCCEPVHDRWHLISKAIPNIKAVSISPWCDMPAMAEMLGKTCVFSRKPIPGPISGVNPDWDVLERDVDATLAAAKDCNLEFIYRDVYRINGERARIRRWVDMVRSKIG